LLTFPTTETTHVGATQEARFFFIAAFCRRDKSLSYCKVFWSGQWESNPVDMPHRIERAAV
jgi:hypothetical protein